MCKLIETPSGFDLWIPPNCRELNVSDDDELEEFCRSNSDVAVLWDGTYENICYLEYKDEIRHLEELAEKAWKTKWMLRGVVDEECYLEFVDAISDKEEAERLLADIDLENLTVDELAKIICGRL